LSGKSVLRSTFSAVLSLAVAGFLLTPSPACARGDGPGKSLLRFSNWNASAYSHKAGGTLCWLMGDDGSLRVEVRRGSAGFGDPALKDPDPEQPVLDRLLDRSGEGWTLVLGPDDAGTLNAWGEEWRQPPVGLAQLVRLVATAVEAFPEFMPDFDFAVTYPRKQPVQHIPRPSFVDLVERDSGLAGIWRYQLNSLATDGVTVQEDSGFRGRMAARGRGAGGDREVVSLTWHYEKEEPGTGVSVRSSRRPGTLELNCLHGKSVVTPPAEIFLPLWPMSRFF
jgi:hypothetical protein